MTSPASAMPTPRRLRVHLIAIWVLAGLLLLVGESALATARHAMKTMGKDAAPSIIAAQEIAADLAELDAQAGNYLFKNGKDAARASFDLRRANVLRRLVDAAENITYGDAEKVPILALFEGLTAYLARIAEMRVLEDGGQRSRAIGAYLTASVELHQRALPAADQLDGANETYLTQAYADAQRATSTAIGLTTLLGVALLVALASLQLFLHRRMRRLVNVPLLVATVLALVHLVYVFGRLGDARDTMRVAKVDAFASVHTLWKARTIAFDANGDETRWLLDPAAAAAGWESSFDARVKKLTSAPSLPTSASSEVRSARVGGRKLTALTGLFADELSNLTFPGEPEAARAMVEAFARYYAIDRKMRELESKGRHDDAVELCTGTKPGQSNAAFAEFDAALLRTIEINRVEFQRHVDAGLSDLARAEAVDPILAVLVALLGWLGVRARLREYA